MQYPFIFTGLATVQAMINKVSSEPTIVMTVFYIVFVLLLPFVYPLLVILAMVDSFSNFRKLDTKQGIVR